MIRFKKPKVRYCVCGNCKYQISIAPSTVKEKTFTRMLKTESVDIIATYLECPVCGERLLKQLDTVETLDSAQTLVKLDSLKKQGKKLSEKQVKSMNSIDRMLSETRSTLNKLYWDEIYQSLNEDTKTEMADQEPKLGE